MSQGQLTCTAPRPLKSWRQLLAKLAPVVIRHELCRRWPRGARRGGTAAPRRRRAQGGGLARSEVLRLFLLKPPRYRPLVKRGGMIAFAAKVLQQGLSS